MDGMTRNVVLTRDGTEIFIPEEQPAAVVEAILNFVR